MDHGTRADQHRAVWNRVVWNAAALVCAGQAHAADLTFDANGASPPDPVGTGAWETTAASWFDGAGFRAWDNTGLHRAVFGAPGTVTLAMPIVAGSLDFRADTTLSGSYLLTLAGTRGITLGEHATAAISAPLTGGFRLSGAATGLLQITGNNAGLYAGTTVLGRGPRLQLGHASALGSATHADALVLEDGARLEFANAATYAYDYTLTGGTARIVPRASSGVFSGAPTLTAPTTLVYGAANTGSQDWKGRLADTGPHALSFTVEAAEGYGPTLFAPNAWSGDTRLRSGQLALANAAALSPDTAVVFDGIGEVQATLVFNYGGTFARTLGHGPGQFRWEGSGGFRSNVGTMTVSFDGDAPLTWGAGGFVPDGRSLHVGGGVVLTNAIDLGALQRTVFGNGTIAGALHGEGGGLRLREGLLTLTAANTWTGATVLDARRGNVFDAQLALGHGQALPGGVGLEGGTSALVLDGGIVLLGPKSGDFLRGLGDGSHQVRFTGSGGFGSASGVRTVDIGGAGETLAWGRDGFVPVGSSLAFAGSANASVVFRNGIDLAGEERTIELASSGIAPQRAVRFEGRFTDGALRLLGFGDAALTGANTYAGRTVIGASDVSTRATIDTLADGGNASGIGASDADAANLVFGSRGANSVATLAYIGGDARTDRDFTMLGNAELLSDGSGAMAWHGAPTVAAGTHTLRLGGATKGNLFAGTLQDGGGRLSLAKHGAGTWRLTGTNTFTGGVRIGGVGNGAPDPGVLEVTALNDAHEAGSLGINASNQASNLTLYSRGVLRYVGDGDSTNRNLMRGLQSGALADRTHGIALESSGSGALEWRGTVTMQNTGNAWLRLGGTHAGDNRFASVLANSAQAVSLAKEGSGTWSLAGANTYTGATEIVDGLLRLAHANALPGGLGADDTSGSPLRLAGGILGLTAASGDLHRKLGAGAGRNALAWTGTHGGFAAFDGTRVVDLGGAGATLTWTAPHYLADGARLQLSHQSADATLDFRNGIDFAGAERVVEVADGTHALDGVLSGVLSGSGAAGLAKTGAGTLRITGDNTYAGRTRLDEGVLEVERIGHAGSVGNLGLGSGGAHALHIDGATLRHVGAGDTSNRGFTIGARGATIAADGYGAMSLDGDVASADATQVRTLWLTGGSLLGNRLGGTLGASGALAVEKQGVGTWVLAGDSTLAQLSIRAGTLQLGDHGTSGSVGDIAIDNHGTLAFARSDVVVLANAIDGPGALAQRGTGTTVLSAQGSRAGRVQVAQGALQVDGTLEAAHVDLGAGTLRILGQMHGSAGHEVTFGDADGADGVLAVEAGGHLRARGTLGGGDDVLHLADDAVLAGTIDGGDAMLGDTVRLDSQRALVFQPASVTGFERLRKTGDGIATTRGAGAYEHGVSVEAGTLRVDAGAALQAPTFGVADGATLAIDGEASGAAGGSAHTTGDAGTSTVRIGAGGWLVASAALGAGTDTLDVAGRLDIGDGRFDLGDGDDVFVVHDGTHVTGAVEGGAGQDTRAYAIESHATLGSLLGFEALEKRGGGILDVLGGASTALAEVGVLGGTLHVGAAATIDGVAVTTIANGATLQVDGRFLGTAGDDTIAIAGVLSGQGSVDLGMGDDTLLIGDGAILHNVVEGGTALHADRVVLDNSRAMTFDAAQVRGFERLQKRNTGVATLTGAHSDHAAGRRHPGRHAGGRGRASPRGRPPSRLATAPSCGSDTSQAGQEAVRHT